MSTSISPDVVAYSAEALAQMDVVYYVKGGEKNDELAHSLRSLQHFPHRRVHIVGHTPKWAKNVNSIPGNMHPNRSGWYNGFDNVRIIAHYDGDMTDDVVIFNDDFVVLRPIEELPLYHRTTLERHAAMVGLDTPWGESLLKTWARLDDLGLAEPLSYDLHVPIPVSRPALREALEWIDIDEDPPVQWRSAYGNFITRGGPERSVHRSDVKIKGRASGPIERDDFLSTTDATIRRPRVQAALRRAVKGGSRYL